MSEAIKNFSRFSDLRVLWHLVAHPVRGESHEERLESFYCGQADHYDSFRARMLHGRSELISSIELPADGVWVDLGAGTGENVILAETSAHALREIHLVDLAPSLLDVAKRRVEQAGLPQVRMHHADATRFCVLPASVDVVTFSYSLTMIPDWFEAISAAERMLKPGGTIAITDFFVSRKYAADDHQQHGWIRRAFWTHWFYIGTLRERRPISFGLFRRNAVLFKTLALVQLFLLYAMSFDGEFMSLGIVIGGFALATYATMVLGMSRTYFSAELGLDSSERIERFPYGMIRHPMILGAMAGIAGMLLAAAFRNTYGWLIAAHLACYLVVLAQEISVARRLPSPDVPVIPARG